MGGGNQKKTVLQKGQSIETLNTLFLFSYKYFDLKKGFCQKLN